MEHDKRAAVAQRATVPFAGETAADFRARVAHEQAEILERRQRELLEQASTLNSPAERIRTWERLHQVDLPANPAHRLIQVIASDTGLTVDEVCGEQRLRATPPAP